jgi:hypothetical protein
VMIPPVRFWRIDSAGADELRHSDEILFNVSSSFQHFQGSSRIFPSAP